MLKCPNWGVGNDNNAQKTNKQKLKEGGKEENPNMTWIDSNKESMPLNLQYLSKAINNSMV